MVLVLLFTKKIFAILARFSVLCLAFLGLAYLTGFNDTFFVFSQYLIYVLFVALLIIGIWFRKQIAVLLICLFLLIMLPLDFLALFFGGVEFDFGFILNGIVILLSVNVLLLGLFQEGHIRLGAMFSLFIIIGLQTLSMFAVAHYVGSGAIQVIDHGISLDLLPFQLGNLSQEVLLIFLVCLVGSLIKELLVDGAFVSLAVDLLLSLGIFNYLQPLMDMPLNSLFLVWGLLVARYIFKQIYQISYIDQLTGIPSRRALHEQASKLSGDYVVAMADIDFFKKFNDKYGHDVGDDVLAFVASILSKHTNGSVFRYGGEEFTLLFRKSSLNETLKHLDEVRQHVATSKFRVRRSNTKKGSNAGEVAVTISIGAAEHSDKNRSFNEVIKAADKALYRAKRKGRNCVSK